MQVRVKPKSYGPLHLHSDEAASLVFETEAGNRVRAGQTPAADALSPSDLILASLANCIAISMRMAASQMAIELGTLDLSAIAIKATDLPNRFGRFEVTIKSGVAVDTAKVDELLRRTKDICTVSNTLGAQVVLLLNP
jgi:uncharacterized OsmC-like protein